MASVSIKVERPGVGDPMRYVHINPSGQGSMFLAGNRNKRSISLNLQCDEGKQIIYRLARQSDVAIHNFRPGVMERLQLGYETLSKINPKIIYAQGSGFGPDGPYVSRKGQDLIAQGMGGILSITGQRDSYPTPAGAPIADYGGARLLALSIVMALYVREKTGQGQEVSVSLLDEQIQVQSEQATHWLNTGEQRPRGLRGAVAFFPGAYGVYKTKDHFLTLNGPVDQICKVLGLPDLSKDPRFDSPQKQVINRDELRALLQEVLINKSTQEWIREFEVADILCGPVNSYREVFSDPQVLHNEMVVEMNHPTAGRIRLVGQPMKLKRTPATYRLPPPLLGEHTDKILADLGYGAEQIRSFRKSGVV